MSTLSQAGLHEYLDKLDVHFHEIPQAHAVKHAARDVPEEESDTTVEPGTKASVSAGSIQVCLPGVTPQMQQDVLNSTLLAQLAAQKAAGGGPEKNPEVWYAKYREVLGNVGWVIKQFDMSKIDVAQFNNASDVVLKLASDYLTDQEQKLLARSISVITEPRNSKPYGIFNNSAIAVTNDSAGFNIGAISAQQGNPTFKIGFNYYIVDANIRQPGCLLFKFKSTNLIIDFRAGNQSMTLNSQYYETYAREKVLRKLGNNVANYICQLQL